MFLLLLDQAVDIIFLELSLLSFKKLWMQFSWYCHCIFTKQWMDCHKYCHCCFAKQWIWFSTRCNCPLSKSITCCFPCVVIAHLINRIWISMFFHCSLEKAMNVAFLLLSLHCIFSKQSMDFHTRCHCCLTKQWIRLSSVITALSQKK